MNNDIKALLFEGGNKFYILMEHNIDNLLSVKKVLDEKEYGSTISIKKVKSDSLYENQLLQLFLNGLSNSEHSILRFNNLTGHLYIVNPGNINSSQIRALEVSVNQENLIKLSVRTFTSTAKKKKMVFDKKPYNEYSKYILTPTNSLRRKLDNEKGQTYILKQMEGKRSRIPFLNISNEEEFKRCKIGILQDLTESFNLRYSGLINIAYQTISQYKSIDTRTTKDVNKKAVKDYFKDKTIKIVNCIDEEQGNQACEMISAYIYKNYGFNSKVGKRLSKTAFNIRLIHTKEYYEDSAKDPHDDNLTEYTVQHITFEDFISSMKNAINAVFYELIIKHDISNSRFSLFDWSSLGFSDNVSFGICTDENNPRYFFMKIATDGTFSFKEIQLDLFSLDEYSDCVNIFESNKKIKGIIKFSSEDILAIKDTDMFTIPQMMLLKEELSKGNSNLRNRICHDKYLTAVTEIKSFNFEGEDYYFVGEFANGIQSNLATAAIIRSVFQLKSGRSDFQQILPLMNVNFVRNGRLTVIPFPFKYLREYALSQQ